MNWTDEAIILSVRPHGETASIVELLTREHGRHAGLVHGGQSRKRKPLLQPGNHVDVTWKGRLAEQLGHMSLELRRSYAGEAMEEPMALAGLLSLTALARLLPERDPHPNLYEIAQFVLGFLDDPSAWPALYVRWELALLEELGVGLDLKRCAATGTTADLVYVSPKSGRAVSAEAGAPYRDRLLALPSFLIGDARGGVSARQVADGLTLTGHFLITRVLGPREETLPEPRQRLVQFVQRM